MKCDLCKTAIADGNPVHRVSVGYFYQPFGGRSVGYICATCKITEFKDWGRRWGTPQPCANCGRPVAHDNKRRKPKFVVCGPRCRQAVYYSRYRVKRQPTARACAVCGQQFTPARGDARFCSAACKQRNYRALLGKI